MRKVEESKPCFDLRHYVNGMTVREWLHIDPNAPTFLKEVNPDWIVDVRGEDVYLMACEKDWYEKVYLPSKFGFNDDSSES